jgi:hypothetical protein
MTLGVAVAYVIVQSARWLSDIEHGRAEMALAHGVSRSRLVLERTAALVAGVTAVAAGGVAGIALGAWSSGMTINSTGIMRTVGATVLMSLAVGGVGLLIVAWLRSGLAIALLTPPGRVMADHPVRRAGETSRLGAADFGFRCVRRALHRAAPHRKRHLPGGGSCDWGSPSRWWCRERDLQLRHSQNAALLPVESSTAISAASDVTFGPSGGGLDRGRYPMRKGSTEICDS